MNKKVIKLCSRKPLECLWSVVFIKNKYLLSWTTPTHVASYLWRDLEIGDVSMATVVWSDNRAM